MRPYWKGYLKLALVSCPIALHAACSSAERIALRQINKATGNRLRQQLIDEETREPVAPEHKGRGYEVVRTAQIGLKPSSSRTTGLRWPSPTSPGSSIQSARAYNANASSKTLARGDVAVAMQKLGFLANPSFTLRSPSAARQPRAGR